jgi:endo-1,4-beta-D-glucanase Y
MTIRSLIYEFYRRLQLANDLRIWKKLPTSINKTILFDTDDYGVAEDWTEWDTSSSID